MKTSIKITAVLGLALLAGVTAGQAADTSNPPPAAPERPRMKEMQERRIKELEDTLHLTPEQTAQVREIWHKAGQQMRAERKAEAQATADHREKSREELMAARQQVRSVLTPEQQKIFDAMPLERRPHAGHAERAKDPETK